MGQKFLQMRNLGFRSIRQVFPAGQLLTEGLWG